MILRLKSRTQSPINGFRFVQPQTGWQSWEADPQSLWDFNLLCRNLQAHRLANPFYKLNTNLETIMAEVDLANAKRMAAIPGGENYITNAGDAVAVASFLQPSHDLASRAAAAVSEARKLQTGAALLLDWLGDSGRPNDPAEAQARAEVCAACPMNVNEGIGKWFKEKVAGVIQGQIEMRNKLKIATTVDDKLHICEGCGCVLKLKVHVPASYITTHTTPEALEKLHPDCWIRKL